MRVTSPNEARAVSRHVRTSPFKVRQVLQGLRGMQVEAAQRQLAFSPKNAADQVLKTLNSAIANAENNMDLDAEDLFVLQAYADEGPTLKRFQPRAMGRAYRIRKRTSHITVTVGIPTAAQTGASTNSDSTDAGSAGTAAAESEES